MKKILLIITGSIAAYKSLELIRRLRERNYNVQCVLTSGGGEFITPLSVASLSGLPVYTDLFSLKDETEMGHIRLSREADIILVAPASADSIAKMVHGRADDLATAILLAADKPVFVAPAMNAKMWEHPATQRNIAQLKKDGATVITPTEGMLACGEEGNGRMAEVEDMIAQIESYLTQAQPLVGIKALVTSGPTYEAIDPVRFIANRSSGKQGHAIAVALAEAGAHVTLVSGPVSLPDPKGMNVVHVESAEAMWKECEKVLPVDIAVCAAAVADWKVKNTVARKIKKQKDSAPPTLTLEENPDILKNIAKHAKRPKLVVGFAAETEFTEKNAKEKRLRKGCDWMIANEVAADKIFNQDENEIILITDKGSTPWPRMRKQQVAEKLVHEIIHYFSKQKVKLAK